MQENTTSSANETLAAKVREAIAFHGAPMNAGEIVAALMPKELEDAGEAERTAFKRRVYWAIGEQRKEGILVIAGEPGYCQRYTFGRKPRGMNGKLPEAEREARRLAAYRKRHPRTMAEYNAERAAAAGINSETRAEHRRELKRAREVRRQAKRREETAKRRAEREATKGARAAQAQAKRNETRAARLAAPPAARVAPAKPAPLTRPCVAVEALPIAPVVEQRETVAEWMARTGKSPELLEVGAVSRPLNFDHRAMSAATWRANQSEEVQACARAKAAKMKRKPGNGDRQRRWREAQKAKKAATA